ncbi:MAG TPA: hypothetical protein IAC70_05825 [Candidatus Faecicola pullistercoris]|nr:hypothetical protein [Candidatus Faecicola pullistercoris]
MDWIEEVKQKQKRKNTILLSKNSPVLHRLKMRLSECNRRAVVLWALELANEAATALKKKYKRNFSRKSSGRREDVGCGTG